MVTSRFQNKQDGNGKNENLEVSKRSQRNGEVSVYLSTSFMQSMISADDLLSFGISVCTKQNISLYTLN